MTNDYGFPVPAGETRGFIAAAPEPCPDCKGWKGYVAQLNDRRTHARPFCATPCIPTAELAEERAWEIADAMEIQRLRKAILAKVAPRTIGAVDAIKRELG